MTPKPRLRALGDHQIVGTDNRPSPASLSRLLSGARGGQPDKETIAQQSDGFQVHVARALDGAVPEGAALPIVL